jgi:hypothetical protein
VEKETKSMSDAWQKWCEFWNSLEAQREERKNRNNISEKLERKEEN